MRSLKGLDLEDLKDGDIVYQIPSSGEKKDPIKLIISDYDDLEEMCSIKNELGKIIGIICFQDFNDIQSVYAYVHDDKHNFPLYTDLPEKVLPNGYYWINFNGERMIGKSEHFIHGVEWSICGSDEMCGEHYGDKIEILSGRIK
jgi:hypothetical protein